MCIGIAAHRCGHRLVVVCRRSCVLTFFSRHRNIQALHSKSFMDRESRIDEIDKIIYYHLNTRTSTHLYACIHVLHVTHLPCTLTQSPHTFMHAHTHILNQEAAIFFLYCQWFLVVVVCLHTFVIVNSQFAFVRPHSTLKFWSMFLHGNTDIFAVNLKMTRI